MLKLGKTWANFKAISTKKSMLVQYDEDIWDDSYYIYAIDDQVVYECRMIKDGGADVVDFETNFKPKANANLNQLDSDGASMSRVKVAPSGWNFNLRGIEFQTSTVGSIVNKDAANADLSDAALKLYASDGTLITDQTTATLNCVKTVLDIEPPYDIYISGGRLRFLSVPSVDVRLAVVGVPDVPAQYGGSKPFVQNVNLRYIPLTEGVSADGRAAKWLQYSATYHTNKLRFIAYHGAGFAAPMEVILETYKL